MRRAEYLESITDHLHPDEAARLAANVLDRIYGDRRGEYAMQEFAKEMSPVLVSVLIPILQKRSECES